MIRCYSGKTVLFDMAMARFFDIDLRNHASSINASQVSKERKIVYVAPSKTLCEERCRDWSTRFADTKLGIEVSSITGDGDPSEAYRDLQKSHIVITTPEKWDSLTRRWAENFYLFASCKLLLLDEVHLVSDESRGCCLESIICRMKSIQNVARYMSTTEDIISQSR
jgi:ATP-dependent DNA helicase HFM1/MER3